MRTQKYRNAHRARYGALHKSIIMEMLKSGYMEISRPMAPSKQWLRAREVWGRGEPCRRRANTLCCEAALGLARFRGNAQSTCSHPLLVGAAYTVSLGPEEVQDCRRCVSWCHWAACSPRCRLSRSSHEGEATLGTPRFSSSQYVALCAASKERKAARQDLQARKLQYPKVMWCREYYGSYVFVFV